jgi:hypothetical protein
MMDKMHTYRRPTGLSAGEAFLCAEAWQSGLLHRAYPSADVWASNPLRAGKIRDSIRGGCVIDTANSRQRHTGSEPGCAAALIPGMNRGGLAGVLALQLRFLPTSESMGNHDSKIVDAGSVD